jgi:glycosyltransferase involved in cell wall biosynthesis
MGEPRNPSVSVVIPAYNAARWIAETLDSVLAQTFRDFEVIVVDDGSTDETPDVVGRYGSRVRYLRKEKGGTPSARNAGIRAARGSYIAFVDADDLWLPEKLQLQMELFLKQRDLAWTYCDTVLFQSETARLLYKTSQRTKMYAGDILRPLLLRDFIHSGAPVIKREVFDAVGYFDESPLLQSGEDWSMWLRIASRYPIGFIDLPLVKYRIHRTSKRHSRDVQYIFQAMCTHVNNAVARDPDRLSDLRKHALASVCMDMGVMYLTRGDRLRAREMYARAIRLYPYYVKTWACWLATLLPMPTVNWLRDMLYLFRRYKLSMGKTD